MEQFEAKIQGSVKDNIILKYSKKYYRFLKRNEVKIYVNNKEIKNHEIVSEGTMISFDPVSNTQKDEILFECPLDIIYEDENYMVVNKPVHLNTIPSRSEPKKSLYNAIYTYLKNNNKLRTIHILTRLDKETSGIVLIALNKETAIYMNKNRSHMNKIYYAMVEGLIEEEHFIIDKPIKKSENSIKREISPDGKKSITEVYVLDYINNHTLVKLVLHTGRTHQIRVHMASTGHPLIGDTLYGNQNEFLYLNCTELTFLDLAGNKVTYHANPSWLGAK